MSEEKATDSIDLSRRDALKITGLAFSSLVFGGAGLKVFAEQMQNGDTCPVCDPADCDEPPSCHWGDPKKARRYRYFEQLPPFYPFTRETKSQVQPLDQNEMRITFMGSSIPLNLRKAQQMMSIFVEVGWNPDTQLPRDQFVLDCGSGVCTNYNNMNVGLGRMNKVFLTHLHGDHMSDLIHIYCFGSASDRKSPLFVWGPGPSEVESPSGSGIYHEDGTNEFCKHLRAACRWHSESFSFQTTSYSQYVHPTKESWGLPCDPIPVGDGNPEHDDPDNDSYAMIPIELTVVDYDPDNNVAYANSDTGVKITYFPVIHARNGSIGYKLEWLTPSGQTLRMIYTGDTKPEKLSVDAACNNGDGVDVFIHEMGAAAQIWAMKNTNARKLPDPDSAVVQQMLMVQNSSHSPQGAFGYVLSQISPLPRLTVATHFPTSDDTVSCALKSVRQHVDVVQGNTRGVEAGPNPERGRLPRITWSFDLMVISVTPERIIEQKGMVPNIGNVAVYQPPPGTIDAEGNPIPYGFNAPKYGYLDENGFPVGDPYAQIDTTTQYCPCDELGNCNYREDGY
jgi:ribonuclease Z